MRRTSGLRTFLAGLLLLSSLAHSAIKSQTEIKTTATHVQNIRYRLQSKLDEFQKSHGFPGATLGFVLPDGQSGSVATGAADLQTKRPMAPSDLMLAGSIGKTFVAATMIQLAQEGRVSLDDKIERWFGQAPWFAHLANAKDLTVRMLLNHTSGISNHVDQPGFFKALATQPDRRWKPEELLVFIKDKKPLFAAGKGFHYTDTNYILVGMVIERVTGATLFDEVRRRFLKPLQLDHIVPQEGRVIPGVANGYSSMSSIAGPGGALIVNGKFTINPQVEWAGGGFAATTEDLARWAQAMFTKDLFTPAYLDQMLKEIDTGEVDQYGMGVEIGEGRWGKIYGHDGLFPGYLSAMSYFPQYRVAVAIQFNTDREKQVGTNPAVYLDEAMKIIVGELTGQNLDPATRPAVKVDAKVFDSYVGQYEVKRGTILTISRDGEQMMVQVNREKKAEIFASSETEFFTRRSDSQIKFVKNDQGQVTGLTISQSGRNVPAKKIK